MRNLLLDETFQNAFLWLYISVVVLTGVAAIWAISLATFWMLPAVYDPPDLACVFGIVLRGAIWSVVAAAWSMLGVLGYRWIEDKIERYLEKN
jgi:hypothetical protein